MEQVQGMSRLRGGEKVFHGDVSGTRPGGRPMSNGAGDRKPRKRSKAEVRKLLAEHGIRLMGEEERRTGVTFLTFIAKKDPERDQDD